MIAFLQMKGWQEVHEGEVVLTKEEYERLKNVEVNCEHSFEWGQGYEGGIKQGHKETAREILSELKTIVKSEYGTYNEKYSLDWNTGCDMGMGHLLWEIKEIVKEKYGV